jgi:hypothetical protein
MVLMLAILLFCPKKKNKPITAIEELRYLCASTEPGT